MDDIRALTIDVFGTTVDWYTGVTTQAAEVFAELDVAVDAGGFASRWRGQYQPALARVLSGEREWAYLDTLHRESLDAILTDLGVADAVDAASRERLVRAWHQLPAWPDAVAGLRRLSRRYPVAALSNGGFALLTHLVKAAELPFDCILSAELAHSYKPGAAAYLRAVELLDLAPEQVLMVAAHAWDLDGARAAGLATAFVERPAEKGPDEPADRAADVTADLSVTSFVDLADALGC
jgi:2-haloacid dehalogenase